MLLFNKNIIFYLLLLPLVGSVILLITPSWNKNLLKSIALFFSSVTFVLSLFLWVIFDRSTGNFQFVEKLMWLPNLNLNFTVGIDGISVFFVILTTLLIFLCLLTSWNSINFNLKEYLISFLVMEFFLIGVFCILDLLLFYIFLKVY